jgi:hypothetical protein
MPTRNKGREMSIKAMSVEELQNYIDSGEMQDLLSILDAHQKFADECKKRLIEKWKQGYQGWDVQQLEQRLLEKAQILVDPSITANEQIKTCVDIANFAMMIHHQA